MGRTPASLRPLPRCRRRPIGRPLPVLSTPAPSPSRRSATYRRSPIAPTPRRPPPYPTPSPWMTTTPPSPAPRRFLPRTPPALPPPEMAFHLAAGAASHSAGFVISARPPLAGTKGESQWDRGLGADGVTGSDLFSAYMNLQGFDALTSSEDNHEDLNSRESGSKTSVAGSSENEADSSSKGHAGGSSTVLPANDSSRKEGVKPSSEVNPDMANFSHCRSLSMDRFTGKFNYEAPPPKLLPSPGLRAAQSSKANSWDGAPNTFSLEFGNGQFTGAEMKKIMENGKLIEMAMTDPKRVKRILANRQSAARSKERRMKYIAELEHKVQALQTQTTTLSAQLTLLQRDSAGLANQNNELMFRLQAMEQQAQLRDGKCYNLTSWCLAFDVTLGLIIALAKSCDSLHLVNEQHVVGNFLMFM
ncbi:Basic region leucine zipper [Musa troglodytarum]|uniref:Basic region leucine zipper n=1 Tax=Musa troglodytarum TaxID=320322 RepID=A0A9E7FVJ7_9LILI|nr:Basic region leucine zipper [Musa troglodytarum]